MIVLYVGSSESYAGKSLACLVLGKRYQQMGMKIGYFKPLGALPTRVGNVTTDEDAAFIADALGLENEVRSLCPVLLTPEMLHQVFTGSPPDFAGAIDRAFAEVSKGKDLVLVGGLGSVCCTGLMFGLGPAQIVQRLGAKALVVGKYTDDRSADMLLASRLWLGEAVVGMVINEAPRGHLERVKQEVVPFLERAGLEVFGVLPRDQVLNSMSVRELTEAVGGRILCCEEAAEELVEHFSVGAMSAESALRYFRRTSNKAVITGGDRSDIQAAALDTSTRCIILTGDLYPDSRILDRAQQAGVPLILTREDTLSAVERIERVLGKLRMREPKKIQRALELAEEHVDFARLDAALGIKGN